MRAAPTLHFARDPPHSRHPVQLGNLNEQVIIDSTSDNRHAVASPEPLSGPACLLARFGQSLDEILPGNLIEEDLPRRPPRHMIRLRKKCLRYGGRSVVDRARVSKALVGHDESLTKAQITVTTENELVYG